ncbi:hypothetical protein B9479_002379 [Cryptococcus floricola]|uniref:AAA+ ATPase domain-containing protein n=1 Tax=Cryptococcus floricola TaxID=2591691 RepID=A0A5D3B2F5_9TREE|nr:hypothetical protein B9479_002379 [Cryptococcus floricola]
MPSPKRTRSEDGSTTSSTPSTPSSSRSHTRAAAPVENTPVAPSTATSARLSSRRQIFTRSQSTTTNLSDLARPPRRTTLLGPTSSLPNMGSPSNPFTTGTNFAMTPPTTRTRSSGTSMLLRTQSTPSLTSAGSSSLKSLAGAPAGESEKPEKDGLGESRRFGKGKENIPPKRAEQNDEVEGPRKRIRLTSRSSFTGASGRGRSGSVASIRSESTNNGRHASLAPSTSSMASWGRASSPTPSDASFSTTIPDLPTPTQSFDRLTFDSDPLETPTKSRATRAHGLLTPPPSSPSIMDVDPFELSAGPRFTKEVGAYKQLKAALRLSAISGSSLDDTIIGRDEEKSIISAYLNNTDSTTDVGMYVSGPPGTGKTASVTAFGRQRAAQGWKVVELGCMGLKVGDVWKRLGEEFGCGKSEKDVVEYIKSEATPTFIILDEVDSLMPPPPSKAPPAVSHLLAKLFSLPHSNPLVKMIAISNTLDLTIRARLVLPNNLQPSVLPFKAYGSTDMSNIVNARIAAAAVEGVKVDNMTITLLGKKVEAQNGDLRMCLGVLGSAISLAEAEYVKKLSHNPDPSKPVVMTKVAITHMMKALASYTEKLRASAGSAVGGKASETGKKVKSVQLQGKMVLMSMLVYLIRVKAGLHGCPSMKAASAPASADPEIPATVLYATYSYLLSHATSPFSPAAQSDYLDLLTHLESLGLISQTATSGRGGAAGNMVKIVLCVREEEVREGLGLGEGQEKGVAEEEVQKVWEREEGRVRRVREKAANAAKAGQDDE